MKRPRRSGVFLVAGKPGLGRATATAGTAAALLLGNGLFGGAATASRRAFFSRTAAAFGGGFAGRAATTLGRGFAGTTTAAATATTRLVRVAVGEFGEFGRADGHNLDIKMQGLTSELMVAVYGDFVTLDISNGEDAHGAIGFSMEAHADLRIIGSERGEGDFLQQILPILTVSELRWDEDALGVAGDEAVDALLEAGDDVLGAVEILHRAAIAGGVDDVALVVLQGVFDGDDSFFGYAHGDWER